MSTILRLVGSQGVRRGVQFLTSKETLRHSVAIRNVSTSPKKNEQLAEQQVYPTKKTWVSYGFCDTDQTIDRHIMHQTFFVCVTICLVFGAFVMGYMPDSGLKDWAQREAYLQLRHREENGLPLVDPNYIDPSLIVLPTDEELGNTEIII